MIDKNLLLGEAAKIADTLRDIRRDLHRHPELGFEEFRTTEKIKHDYPHLPAFEGYDELLAAIEQVIRA